jgi:hypothetical protein
LIQCIGCDVILCARQINFDESDSAEVGQDGTIVPIDVPPKDEDGDEDAPPFAREESCVILNHFSRDGKRPRLEQAKDDFACADCWDRKLRGLYPVRSSARAGFVDTDLGVDQHYVRPFHRLAPTLLGQKAPRTAVLIFYIEQFWPHAKHLTALLAARFANLSWPVSTSSFSSKSGITSSSFSKCIVQPVKLEQLGERPVFERL